MIHESVKTMLKEEKERNQNKKETRKFSAAVRISSNSRNRDTLHKNL